MSLKKIIYGFAARSFGVLKRAYYHIVSTNQRNMMAQCGKSVFVEPHCDGNWNNIYCGNDVHIGKNNLFMCALAPITIGDHVMFGPNVTVITGDHRIDIVGRYMTTICNEEKLPENDQPVVFDGDNWIGANVTILKGVKIGEGAVVASGSLVIKEVPPYTIVGGVPAKEIKRRFNEEQIAVHKTSLQ